MTREQPPATATSAAAVAAAHERARPGCPGEAVEWLVGGQARTVLELGAGTGRLSRLLAAAGHDVHAVDPVPEMVKVLEKQVPQVRSSVGELGEVAVPDRSVDVVACAASFHRLDPEEALPAVARALRPGGHLALVWHEPDERIPWVRRLGRLLDETGQPRVETQELLVHSPLFSFVEEKSFKAWQEINRESIRDFVLSRSLTERLSADSLEDRVADVLDLYDEYGRGMDGMQLPLRVHCLRTQVVHQPGIFSDDSAAATGTVDGTGDESTSGEEDEREARRTENFRSDGTDTDMLLIDFR